MVGEFPVDRMTKLRVFMRWMIRRDIPYVIDIEKLSFPTPWTEEEMMAILRQQLTVAYVAEINSQVDHDSRIVGYIVTKLYPERFDIINIAVDQCYRRRGVASRMLEHMMLKLSKGNRRSMTVSVRESNIGAHALFNKMGFKALGITPNPYVDTEEDAYFFEYSL